MSKFLKASFLAFIFVFLWVLIPSSAAAQTWSTPQKINPDGQQSTEPVTTTGPNGYLHTAWAAWPEGDTPVYWSGVQNPGIYYSYWNGDTWSTPVKVSQNTSFAGYPAIAVTSDNKVHIVWEDDSSSASGSFGRILYSSSINYGTNWSTPVSVNDTLDAIPGAWAWYPQIVKDQNNNLHLVFIYYNDEMYNTNNNMNVIYYTKFNGSSWSTPITINLKTTNENVNDSFLAVDTNNNPHVVFREEGVDNLDPTTGIWYRGYNGTDWADPVKLSDNEGEWPRIIIDNLNNRHVVWTKAWYDNANDVIYNKIEYVKWNGSSWSSPTLITNTARYNYWFFPIIGLTFDSSNNVYVGWGELVGWTQEPRKGIEVRYRKWTASSQTWSSPFDMRYVYDLDTVFLYKDKWDNQHFAWTEQDSVTKQWNLWYSTVPVNISSYDPTSSFLLNIANTLGDTLSIPASALASSTNISAQVGPLPASANPSYTTIPRSYTFRPHGLQFAANKNATAVINYTDTELLGADERNLKIYIWDGQANSWSTSFGTNVNRTQNKATVTLPHFSLYGLMAPKVRVNWQPPVINSELYVMKDGSTLPVKFTLTHDDGTYLEAPELAEDVKVVIKDNAGKEKAYFLFGTGEDQVHYDPTTNEYLVNIHTKELNLGLGLFTIEVMIFGQNQPTATITFEITELGKAKGQNR